MKRIALAVFAASIGVTGCTGPIVESYSFSDGMVSQPTRYTRPVVYGLPAALYVVTVKRESTCAITVTMGTPTYVRDKRPQYNFVVQYDHDWNTTDSLTVQTDSNGLLAYVAVTSQNETIAIVTEALKLYGQLRPSTAAKDLALALPGAVACDKVENAYALNPTDPQQWKRVQDELRTLNLDADVEPLYPMDVPTAVRSEPSEQDRDGIYFRLNQPYRISVRNMGSLPAARADAIFIAPNPDVTYRVRLDKRVFTKFDVKLTFDHGVLTKFESTDPSEALAALKLPSDLIKTFIGLGGL